jgi:predicted ATP-grasp superfamily ATP-dependent carboligase
MTTVVSRETRRELLIVGASARAAAFSARRAGFSVYAADLFADQDLRDCAVATVPTKAYPRGLLKALEKLPPLPWLYTGGLENHDRLIDLLAAKRRLYGNRGSTLRRIRDPFKLQACLARRGFHFPETLPSDAPLPEVGPWLLKGYRGTGGHQVAPWQGESPAPNKRRRFYLQQRLDGQPCGAVYIAASGRAVLLGVTRQLVGCAWCGAPEFHYCGSLGPLELPPATRDQFQRLGECLADEFALAGVFGVDVILRQNRDAGSSFAIPWVLEVNPRYPASAEVLDRALNVSTVGLHVASCRDRVLPSLLSDSTRCAGKAILYAPRDFVVCQRFAALIAEENRSNSELFCPRVADVPVTGSTIRRGWPVLTLLENGSEPGQIERRLRDRAAAIYKAMAAL